MSINNMFSAGNGEKVKCKHCEFSFTMQPEKSYLLFEHSHEGVDFFETWELIT